MRLTDVGVVDLCEKPDLWRAHGVLFRQKQLQREDAVCMHAECCAKGTKRWGQSMGLHTEEEGLRTLEWTSIGSLDRYIEVPEVVFVWCSRDAWRRVGNEAFCLLKAQKIEKDMARRNDESGDSGRVGVAEGAP